MDAVHGRGGVTKAGKATVQPGRWAGAAGAQDVPHSDVALISSIRRSPYHRNGKSCTSFAWRCFVDCFTHENGNCGAAVNMRSRARDSAEDAAPMCALSRRQSMLGEEGIPVRLEDSPSLWLDSWRHPRCPLEGRSLAEGKDPREALQAWRA